MRSPHAACVTSDRVIQNERVMVTVRVGVVSGKQNLW
jgi:hypothetical protein